MSSSNQQPSQSLPMSELESLLRLARENSLQQSSSIVSEELGPGDVQYLRGHSMKQPNLNLSSGDSAGWMGNASPPDSLLSQAERHLAEAILDSDGVRSSERAKSNTAASPPLRSSVSSVSRQGLTLEDLGDVDLDISIELGRTEILIEDILKLREGSVVELDKLAGDPVDIMANGRLVARGELLVIDGKFGVRLSEVL